ncbi:hypothetical protein VT52_000135 [Streptomyces malaysiense]|uniref:Uncharacterized protein n=1 Tax=Streptomyces malaysiense TaxID=1428626 RepID=A0A1J4QBT9_9ACTN|nr:hypothetical protein VT52_000135 [Streptomyces malaysiense]
MAAGGDRAVRRRPGVGAGGRFLPGPPVRPELLPFLPDVPGPRVQAPHTDDAAEAYRLAVRSATARGAFDLAAEPPLDAAVRGELLGARPVRLPRGHKAGREVMSLRPRGSGRGPRDRPSGGPTGGRGPGRVTCPNVLCPRRG